PLTANGKVDKKALPEPSGADLLIAGQSGVYITPQTDTELQLSEIWAELLSLSCKDISTDANFFKLGGHSLLSVRMLTDIRNSFEVQLTLGSIFEFESLQRLAGHIDLLKPATQQNMETQDQDEDREQFEL
ncbi:MAG: non-ribosomal peptide synthetase, partial [Algicola sp.]|nr:non-ribosomal peptide synthetase [Algicola sp.]